MNATLALSSCLCALTVGVAPPQVVEQQPDRSPSPAAEAPPDAAGSTARSSSDDRYDVAIREFTARFTSGNALVEAGAFLEAGRQYELAFAAFPASDALYNASLAYERGGDLVAAARAARRYLRLPACEANTDPEGCPVMADEVRQTLTALMRQIGELRLDIAEGVRLAQVRVDGRSVPTADFPVLLAPGSIDVELIGGERGEKRLRSIVLRPGESQAIYVGPFDRPEAPRLRPSRDTPVRQPKPKGAWAPPAFWTSLSLTIASGAATGIVGGITRASEKEFESHYLGDGKFDDEGYRAAAERRFHRARTATNALAGVTAGFAVLTVVTGIVAHGYQRRVRRNARTRAQLTVIGVRMHF